jgi:two-component system, cell cycle response regulator
LSAQDRASLAAMRKALLNGMLVAIAVAVVLGMLLGSRFGARVRELTLAIRSMRADGELLQQVPVRSRDEMGELVEAFNRMSNELTHAHAELKATTAQVQLQSEQLKELSIRDPLTHLFNRRYFDEHALQLYRQAVRGGRSLCMVVGDLDLFKEINDSFSHAVGDAVLRRIADLMRQNIRRSDVVARYGGEEFVIALPDCTEEQAAVCCEKLRLAIERYPWGEVHHHLRVTMSMGLCGSIELGGFEKMLAAADSALYEAKRGGRNRVVCSRSL